jgi:hypothetical protein
MSCFGCHNTVSATIYKLSEADRENDDETTPKIMTISARLSKLTYTRGTLMITGQHVFIYFIIFFCLYALACIAAVQEQGITLQVGSI